MVLRRTWTALLALCLACLCGETSARTVEYTLELPAHQRLTYRVEFEVPHPGEVVVEGRWEATRVLVFRLERPGSGRCVWRDRRPSA